MQLLLVPILAAAFAAAAAWQESVTVSGLTDQYVERPVELAPWSDTVTTSAVRGLDGFSAVTYSPGGGLLSFHGYSCDAEVGAFGADPPPLVHPGTQSWGDPIALGDGYAAVREMSCDAKTIGLARLAADGRVLAQVRLGARHDDDLQAALAPGPDGSVAVAWVDAARLRHRQWVRVGLYGRGRWLRRPVTIATRRFNWHRELLPTNELALGVDGRGTVVVAFEDRRSVRVVTVPRRGRLKRPAVFKSSPAVARLALGVSPRGRVAVAWSTFSRAEHNHTPVSIYAALREPGQPFGRARRMEEQPDVDEYADEPGGFPALAVGADGRVALTWDSLVSGRTPLRVSIARPGRGFGAFTTVARDASRAGSRSPMRDACSSRGSSGPPSTRV